MGLGMSKKADWFNDDWTMIPEQKLILEDWLRHQDHPVNRDIWTFMEISSSTLYDWKKNSSEFSDTLKKDRKYHVSKAVSSMERSIEGYYVYERTWRLDPDIGDMVEVERKQKWIKPDPTLLIFYLKNQDSSNWRDRQEIQMDVDEDVQPIALIPKREILSEPEATEGDMETADETG